MVTGSRADYGLLRSLMTAVRADARLTLQVVATGTHLDEAFGQTVGEMEADGFAPDRRVELPLSGDGRLDMARALGAAVSALAAALDELAPDIVVVLGDRFEIFAAAQAALVLRMPIAHIHGGEVTEAAIDDSLRHAITKMAQWHFVAAAPYRDRVVQMGEPPDRVFLVGAPGLDDLDSLPRFDRAALERDLGIALDDPILLTTYHPATLADAEPGASLDELTAALESVNATRGVTVVFTFPNADAGGRSLLPRIERFTAARPASRAWARSLGRDRYLSLMRLAAVVVGNSSSGLIEAPALRRATVDIGDRQHGRLRATSVIHAPERREEIARAIERALSPAFQATLDRVVSPYGAGRAGARIAEYLATVTPGTRKPFVDLPHLSTPGARHD